MKIIDYYNLPRFEFWQGAKANAQMLTREELLDIEDALEEIYPNGINSTELNDLFWFDFENVCSLIGLKYNVETDEIERD